MKVLLDTNIVIHREASKVIHDEIGILFNWLDRLGYTKCIHPLTVEELNRNKNTEVVRTMSIKIGNYNQLQTVAPISKEIQQILDTDADQNDKADTFILNEVYSNRVAVLISEDKRIHEKAHKLGISNKVFKIDGFLEKVVAENPGLVDYKVLAVKKELFGNIDVSDPFFDSFREDYPGFNEWFNRKADEICYVYYHDNRVVAFLYLKVEDENENYIDITPVFQRKKRIKIGTLKVSYNGYKIGERFLKIIFDNAFVQKAQEIYVTAFEKRDEQIRLISLLKEWGFVDFGIKSSANATEKVFIKNFDKKTVEIRTYEPKLTYPFLSKETDTYIVPIYPEYHTDLFPDSILNTESPINFTENEPHRNAISKVFISRSLEKNLKPGDLIVFYRTKDKNHAIHTGVVTTIGIVESVNTMISREEEFIKLCRKRSVFSDEELRKRWNHDPSSRPFIVNFLYAYSYPKRPNLKWLNENGVIPDIKDMPRGFRKITRDQFDLIAKYAFSKRNVK